MKKLLLIIFIAVISAGQVFSQTINLIKAPEKGGFSQQNLTEFKGALYGVYRVEETSIAHLAKFDGTKITLFTNPDAGTLAEAHFIEYKDHLFFQYRNAAGVRLIGRFDGTAVSVLSNPDASTNGYRGNPFIFDNVLYGGYFSTITNQSGLIKYDGNESTFISGASSSSGYYEVNSSIYFSFMESTSPLKYSFYQMVGNSFFKINNPDGGRGFGANYFVIYKGNIYGSYSTSSNTSNLGKLDVSNNTISIIPNPQNLQFNGISENLYDGKLVVSYINLTTNTMHLGFFDGTNLSIIPNDNNGTWANAWLTLEYKDNLYFRYKDTHNKWYLARYNKEDNIVTVIANPESTGNVGPELLVLNGKLYLSYQLGPKTTLATFDGNHISLVTDNNAGAGIAELIVPFNENIYFTYYDENWQAQLGTTATPLPVILSTYTAKAKNNAAVIEWKTLSETNNSHFVLERSFDGKTFKTLDIIEAKGNGRSPSDYLFSDINPLNGVNYYRLSQVDKDGTTKIYDIKAVNFSIYASAPASVYPSPAVTEVNIRFQKGLYTKAELTDLSGRAIITLNVHNNAESLNFQIAELASGIYIIRLSGKENTANKFIKK